VWKQSIEPGDFVIGARYGRNNRSFLEPSQVLEVRETEALVFIGEDTRWIQLHLLERVVTIAD